MPTLYELEGEYKEIAEALSEAEYDSEEEFNALIARLLEVRAAVVEKAAAYIAVIKNFELRAEMVKAEASVLQGEVDRLQSISQRHHEAARRLREAITGFVEEVGTVKSTRGTLYLTSRKRLEVLDESKLPDEAFVTKRELSKTTLTNLLKDGLETDGAALVDTKSVAIR